MHSRRSSLVRSTLTAWLVLVPTFGCHPSGSQTAADDPSTRSSDVSPVATSSSQTLPTSSVTTTGSEAPQPAARVEHDIHDFGRMNARVKGEHYFVIHNDGEAPLELKATETSCSCTIGNVPAEPVAPGNSARIRVQWTAKANDTRFRETITLKTNDPRQPEIQLIVAGTVCREVDAQPVNFGELAPDASRQTVSLITSKVLDSFELSQIGCTIAGIEWETVPATAEQLRAAQARSGWQLRVRLPETMPLGDFQGSIRFRLKPVDNATLGTQDERPLAESERATDTSDSIQLDEVQYEIPVAGKILRRIAVYGPKLDWTGTITLGTVGQGQGFSGNYIVKIRDPDKSLRLINQRVEPEWMEVKFEPYADQDPSRGLYRMTLSIPPDAPISDFTTGRAARIQLDFDHPRAPSLELNVVFSIVNGSRGGPQ